MNELHEDYIRRILSARVYDVAVQTRLHAAPALSARLGNAVLFKREDEQSIFSFKCRGAFNRIHRLVEARGRRGDDSGGAVGGAAGRGIAGVIAASAGNHAQGVALAARRLGLDAVIVMPRTTPPIKIDAVRALGAEVVLHGDDFDTALGHALELGRARGLEFIHPFDAPDTIAGQGTVAVEMTRQHPGALDAVFVPVGGGGLAAGVSAWYKYLRPEVRVIGVEPVDAASMHDALAADERVALERVGLFADGVAVRQVGEHTFELCRRHLDGVVLVTVDEMSAAIRDVFNDTRTLVEPAGALAVAGIKRHVRDTGATGRTFAAVVSGANVNFDRLRHIAERAEIGESREALFAARIPERPGSFRRLLDSLGRRAVTEFNYRYADAAGATVFVGIEIPGGAPEREALLARLRDDGGDVVDLTDNDVAKLHVRHMIGGRADLPRERLFRFRFPERPGALADFLARVGERSNITLFHYRNHGAAYGRVLVGIDVAPGAGGREALEALRRLGDEPGFHCEEESGNAAWAMFLARGERGADALAGAADEAGGPGAGASVRIVP